MIAQLLTKLVFAATAAPPLPRETLALVMFPHGAQKALGWFGGHGWSRSMGFLNGQVRLPAPLAALVVLLEFVAPLTLLAGVGVRLVALAFVGLMVGAVVTVHAPHGFGMNWQDAQQGEGFDCHPRASGSAVALGLLGAGHWSTDQLLAARAGANP